MKVLSIISLIMLALLTNTFAQAGRRIKNPQPAPGSTPQVQLTQQDARETEETAGYSESAPNAPRTLSARPRNNNKAKKEVIAQTPEIVKTTAENPR